MNCLELVSCGWADDQTARQILRSSLVAGFMGASQRKNYLHHVPRTSNSSRPPVNCNVATIVVCIFGTSFPGRPAASRRPRLQSSIDGCNTSIVSRVSPPF